jgi:tetratricopeptide (TPR) repeat protein
MLGRFEIADGQLQQSTALLDGPALAGHDTRAARALTAMPQLRMVHDSFMAQDKPRFEQNLALSGELGDRLGIAEAQYALGSIAASAGSYAEAQQRFEDSLALYRAMGNQWRAAPALNGLGEVARGLGRYDEAREIWQESIDLCRAQSNPRGVAQALVELCYLDQFQGRFEAAARLSRESAALWRETGDRPGLVSALNALGISYIWCGKFDQAHAVLEEAAAICADLGFSSFLAAATIFQSMAKVYAGKYQEVRTQAQTTLKVAGPAVRPLYESAWAQRSLAWTALAEGRFTDALEWAEKSVEAYRVGKAIQAREWLAWSLASLSRAALGLGTALKRSDTLSKGWTSLSSWVALSR